MCKSEMSKFFGPIGWVMFWMQLGFPEKENFREKMWEKNAKKNLFVFRKVFREISQKKNSTNTISVVAATCGILCSKSSALEFY